MRFFVGLHHVSAAKHFTDCMISANTIRKRKSDFAVQNWIMDSGAFTTLATHGRFPDDVDVYAAQIKRWSTVGNLLCAVAQDFMCEPIMLAKTGATVAEHQRWTVERYRALIAHDCGGARVMPVLQGYSVDDYLRHLDNYGDLISDDDWIGVGSVCKRNGRPIEIFRILYAIKRNAPRLRLHGFGLKTTTLRQPEVRALLHSADSMAWSFNARYQGRNQNDWREAKRFIEAINQPFPQTDLFLI